MNINEIINLRLINQSISNTLSSGVKEIVTQMCAVQAQDFNMAEWAVGVRLNGSNIKTIETGLNNAEILRTHVLRPTWHLVTANDIYWMLELTSPRIKSSLKSRHKDLEITKNVINKSKKIFEKALGADHHLTREELVNKLNKSKIQTNNNRASHIFLSAELDGLICSGIIKGKKQTYALLEERVVSKRILYKDEALAELAGRYFKSRGPATLEDFVWWSGLSVRESRNALEMIRNDFVSVKIDSRTFWFKDASDTKKNMDNKIYLLPAYDEFLISYKDRSAVIPDEYFSKTVSNNGIFRPVIIYNGKVIGIWKRVRKKDKVLIEAILFKSPTNSTKKMIKKASLMLGDFLRDEVEVTFIN